MTQPAMTAFTLRRLRASAPFLGPFAHLTKKLMRIGLKLYGSEEPGPRLQVGFRVGTQVWLEGF
jgi:nucleolar complex protein 2